MTAKTVKVKTEHGHITAGARRYAGGIFGFCKVYDAGRFIYSLRCDVARLNKWDALLDAFNQAKELAV